MRILESHPAASPQALYLVLSLQAVHDPVQVPSRFVKLGEPSSGWHRKPPPDGGAHGTPPHMFSAGKHHPPAWRLACYRGLLGSVDEALHAVVTTLERQGTFVCSCVQRHKLERTSCFILAISLGVVLLPFGQCVPHRYLPLYVACCNPSLL